jgi:hypothetical protein
MLVNSAFTGFFTKRLAALCLAIVMLAVFFTASSFTDPSDRDLRAKQVNLMIRQIGHQLLLQAGDPTSRVLPVTELKEGVFLLKFENELVFNHDSLILLTQGLFTKTEFPSGYTVIANECVKDEIVYGYQVNNAKPDILACIGRSQPLGCYTIEFTFPDLYQDAKQNKAEISQLIALVKTGRQEINPKPQESKTTTFGDDSNQNTEKRKSGKIDREEADSKLAALKTTTFDYSLTNVVYGGILLLLGVTLLIGRFGKTLKPVPVQNQDHAIIIKESVPELPALGKFLFNLKGQCLLLGNEVISLTDKECKVLELLHKNFGELIPRETLMQEIWINEGVITGRSLDMFVSKLRKKLSGDPELRITNIHGKGYKLEISESQVI